MLGEGHKRKGFKENASISLEVAILPSLRSAEVQTEVKAHEVFPGHFFILSEHWVDALQPPPQLSHQLDQGCFWKHVICFSCLQACLPQFLDLSSAGQRSLHAPWVSVGRWRGTFWTRSSQMCLASHLCSCSCCSCESLCPLPKTWSLLILAASPDSSFQPRLLLCVPTTLRLKFIVPLLENHACGAGKFPEGKDHVSLSHLSSQPPVQKAHHCLD